MLDELRVVYSRAEEAVTKALEDRLQANIDLCKAVLNTKNIEPEQTVKITESNGKTHIGVFSIVETQQQAVIRFYPYKKDGELSKNPRAFHFGYAPDLKWTDEVTSVEASEPPVVEE